MNMYDPVDILIVDDNANDAELTLRALTKNKLSNKLFIVEDGQAALDFLFCRGKFATRNPTIPPKVVFLDLKLPKMGGLEVLKEIKTNPFTQKLPVVIISSSREDPDIKSAYELGANSYVVKPLDFDEFIDAIQHTGLFWLLVNEAPR